MTKSLCVLAAFTCCYSFAQAPTRLGRVLDEVSRTKQFRQVAISSDGKRVAWTSEGVWIQDVAGASARRVSACSGKCSERSPAWSPDGARLAFLSDADKTGQDQLYVSSAAGGRAHRLTKLNGYLQDVRWSPDGRQIAVLFTANAPRNLGPVEAVIPETGVIEEKIFVQRLTIVDVASGELRQITPPGVYVFEYDWAPDSKRLVYDAAPPPGDNNWYLAELYTIAIGGEPQHLYKPPLQIASPRWSPDGSSIAWIGGLMSDEGSTGGEIYTISPSGGTPKDVTPRWKSSPSQFEWLPDSTHMTVVEHVSGSTAISTLDVKNGSTGMLWKGDETLTVSLAPSASAVVRSSWSQPPEVWAGPAGKWRRLTHSNDGLQRLWGEAKSVEWQSDDFRVQGWLLCPQDYDPNKKHPMIVSVHGGPASEKRPAWPGSFFDLSVLAGQGYFVFFPNPRGSFGQGETFTRANVKDFGYGDMRDIVRGVDKVVHDYPIDANRIGIAGWSYGGYMTMWAVTQTARFRAAVAGAGLSNWRSYYGENSIDQWMIPYFGASVYDDPGVYEKSSPIHYIKNVKTPTLVLVGELDGEVPEPQSREFWHALKTLGVNTRFVVYPGEGHRFHDPAHIRDLMERTAHWFDTEMAR